MKTALMSVLKGIWELVVKDLLSGILLSTVKDVLKKFVEKTPWSIIVERLLTRVLVFSLKWLASLSTNQLWVDTVNDLLSSLQGQGLKEAKPIAITERNKGPVNASADASKPTTPEPAT